MSELTCSDCGKGLKPNPLRKGTRCRPCLATFLARDPEIRARATAKLREALKDPKVLARRGRGTSKALRRKMRKDPDYAQRQRESGRRLGLSGAGIQRHGAGSDARVRAGRSASATKRKGVPAAYYEDYRRLVHDSHYPAEEAIRMVLELQARERKRKIKARLAGERLAGMDAESRIRLGSAVLGMAFARAAAKEARA